MKTAGERADPESSHHEKAPPVHTVDADQADLIRRSARTARLRPRTSRDRRSRGRLRPVAPGVWKSPTTREAPLLTSEHRTNPHGPSPYRLGLLFVPVIGRVERRSPVVALGVLGEGREFVLPAGRQCNVGTAAVSRLAVAALISHDATVTSARSPSNPTVTGITSSVFGLPTNACANRQPPGGDCYELSSASSTGCSTCPPAASRRRVTSFAAVCGTVAAISMWSS